MSSNTTLGFSAGALVATPAGGSPIQFGTLQEVSVDFSVSLKDLMGQYQIPVATARGAMKITGKAKSANITAALFNNIFFPNSIATTGQKLWAINEAGAIPSASAYTYTVANAAHFDADLGVQYASSGLQLVQVGSAPAQGQYAVAAGVYTFNSADAGRAIFVTYTYTQTTTGSNIVISNQLMGVQTNFQIDFYENNPAVAGSQWSLRLYQCVSSKLSLGAKNEDWTVPDIEFSAFANAANDLGEINTAA